MAVPSQKPPYPMFTLPPSMRAHLSGLWPWPLCVLGVGGPPPRRSGQTVYPPSPGLSLSEAGIQASVSSSPAVTRR